MENIDKLPLCPTCKNDMIYKAQGWWRCACGTRHQIAEYKWRKSLGGNPIWWKNR